MPLMAILTKIMQAPRQDSKSDSVAAGSACNRHSSRIMARNLPLQKRTRARDKEVAACTLSFISDSMRRAQRSARAELVASRSMRSPLSAIKLRSIFLQLAVQRRLADAQ